jgi:16S rRNA (adenine1518-N6/adenine1519-N6)-dimethyltransferase
VTLLKKLAPTVFWPRPKVSSAIMQLTPDRKAAAAIVDRPFFQDYIRRLFHQRRKHLRSVLAGMYRKQLSKGEIDQLLAAMSLDETARAEELPASVHVELANRLHAAVQERVTAARSDQA